MEKICRTFLYFEKLESLGMINDGGEWSLEGVAY